jgi:hypothetical protein
MFYLQGSKCNIHRTAGLAIACSSNLSNTGVFLAFCFSQLAHFSDTMNDERFYDFHEENERLNMIPNMALRGVYSYACQAGTLGVLTHTEAWAFQRWNTEAQDMNEAGNVDMSVMPMIIMARCLS